MRDLYHHGSQTRDVECPNWAQVSVPPAWDPPSKRWTNHQTPKPTRSLDLRSNLD